MTAVALYHHVYRADDGEPIMSGQFQDEYEALEDLAESPSRWTSYCYTAVITTLGCTITNMEDDARALADEWRAERRFLPMAAE